MKTSRYIVYFGVLFLSFLLSDEIENKIKRLEVKEYRFRKDYSTGENIEILHYYEITENKYDSNNNLVESLENGEKTTYKYDSDNNLIERNDPYGKKVIWEYNTDTLRVSVYNKFYKDIENQQVFIYDSNGNQVERFYTIEEYQQVSDVYNRSVFRYDSNNNLIEEVSQNTYVPEETITTKKIYKYDSNDNIIEEHYYDRTGNNSINKYEYKYDSNDNIIEKKYDYFNKKIIYTYDSNDRKNKESMYIKGSLSEVKEYKYDSNNNIIEFYMYSNVDEKGIPVLTSKNIYKYEYYK
tara:strand:- start:60 stop:944 length:885 start_codon:yes stop_codon:yes gene_type:complete